MTVAQIGDHPGQTRRIHIHRHDAVARVAQDGANPRANAARRARDDRDGGLREGGAVFKGKSLADQLLAAGKPCACTAAGAAMAFIDQHDNVRAIVEALLQLDSCAKFVDD